MLDRFISGIAFILEVRRQPGLEQEAGRRRRRRGGGFLPVRRDGNLSRAVEK